VDHCRIALGALRERAKTLPMLDLLPEMRVAQLSELRLMIEARHLYSLGIGVTDAQLIASVLLNPPTYETCFPFLEPDDSYFARRGKNAALGTSTLEDCGIELAPVF
jgi:hypothetical protein